MLKHATFLQPVLIPVFYRGVSSAQQLLGPKLIVQKAVRAYLHETPLLHLRFESQVVQGRDAAPGIEENALSRTSIQGLGEPKSSVI